MHRPSHSPGFLICHRSTIVFSISSAVASEVADTFRIGPSTQQQQEVLGITISRCRQKLLHVPQFLGLLEIILFWFTCFSHHLPWVCFAGFSSSSCPLNSGVLPVLTLFLLPHSSFPLLLSLQSLPLCWKWPVSPLVLGIALQVGRVYFFLMLQFSGRMGRPIVCTNKPEHLPFWLQKPVCQSL